MPFRHSKVIIPESFLHLFHMDVEVFILCGFLNVQTYIHTYKCIYLLLFTYTYNSYSVVLRVFDLLFFSWGVSFHTTHISTSVYPPHLKLGPFMVKHLQTHTPSRRYETLMSFYADNDILPYKVYTYSECRSICFVVLHSQERSS